MTNIDKICQEIERRKEELERDKYINIDAKTCRQSELKYLERFLDSLPEEKPSEDLEEAAKEYVKDIPTFKDSCLMKAAFEDGWLCSKEKMLKEAVECEVADLNGEIYNNCIEKGMTDEDKVKIVIVKEDD